MATTYPPLLCAVPQRTETRRLDGPYMAYSTPHINRSHSLVAIVSRLVEVRHRVFSIVHTRMETCPYHHHQASSIFSTRRSPRVHPSPSSTDRRSFRREPTTASAPSPSAGRRASAAIGTFSTPLGAEAAAPAVLSAASSSPRPGSFSRVGEPLSTSCCRDLHPSPPWLRTGFCLRVMAATLTFPGLVTSSGEMAIAIRMAGGISWALRETWYWCRSKWVVEIIQGQRPLLRNLGKNEAFGGQQCSFPGERLQKTRKGEDRLKTPLFNDFDQKLGVTGMAG